MRTNSDERADTGNAGLRDIPTWARRYAQNRSLPVLVFLLMGGGAFAVFGGVSYLGALAYKAGERFLAAVAMLIVIGFGVWWLWFSFVGAFGIISRITERLYQREGSVIAGTSQPKEYKRLPLVGFVFSFCVLATIGLCFLGFYSISLMQPISALYVVPFLCYLGLKLRPVGSPFMFLWPALYGIHAVLIVAGAPIRLGPVLDIIVPTFGYGLIAVLAGHIYSRFALRRLRSLAAIPDSPERKDG